MKSASEPLLRLASTRLTSEIPHFDTLGSDDRLILMDEILGLFPPERQSDGPLRLIDQGEVSFGKLCREEQKSVGHLFAGSSPKGLN
jgi:hypothetical protein